MELSVLTWTVYGSLFIAPGTRQLYQESFHGHADKVCHATHNIRHGHIYTCCICTVVERTLTLHLVTRCSSAVKSVTISSHKTITHHRKIKKYTLTCMCTWTTAGCIKFSQYVGYLAGCAIRCMLNTFFKISTVGQIQCIQHSWTLTWDMFKICWTFRVFFM